MNKDIGFLNAFEILEEFGNIISRKFLSHPFYNFVISTLNCKLVKILTNSKKSKINPILTV
jgi:predicted RecB family nuclease